MPQSEINSSSLEEFARTGNESAFRKVVEEHSGLVFASALRRTGNHELAEEITQNVFTSLARKAESISRHPSLAGWLFTVTKFETAQAMRARQRHQRKLDALTQSSRGTSSQPHEESWQDLLPHLDHSLDRLSKSERNLLLARFTEEKSFRDLSTQFEKSEAACKMQIKRTLEKLHRWLTAKGATLSITTLSAILGTEITKAAPSALAATLPSNALAAAANKTASRFTIVHTMSQIKTTTAVAAIIVLSAIPITMQYSTAKDLRHRLDELKSQDLTHRHSPPTRTVRITTLTPVRKYLASTRPPASGEVFLQSLQNAMISQNVSEILRLFIPIARMTQSDFTRLVDEVASTKKNQQMKGVALRLLSGISPSQKNNHRANLERALTNEVDPSPLSDDMKSWSHQAPEEALAWFRENQKNGRLLGKGIYESPEKNLGIPLAINLSKYNLASALAFAEEVQPENRTHILAAISADLVVRDAQGRDQARNLIAKLNLPEDTRRVLEKTLHALIRKKHRDQIPNFLNSLNLDSDQLTHAYASATTWPGALETVPERMNWLLENIHGDLRLPTMRTAVKELHLHDPKATSAWINTLPSRELRKNLIHSNLQKK